MRLLKAAGAALAVALGVVAWLTLVPLIELVRTLIRKMLHRGSRDGAVERRARPTGARSSEEDRAA